MNDLRARAVLIHDRLCAAYGCPFADAHPLDPVSELVSSLLSHRTKNAESAHAFAALLAAFGSWSGVRDAPTRDVERTIAGITWPQQKAPRLQEVLREITARTGTLDDAALSLLATMTPRDARVWLESLTGVGPKTSAAVLIHSTLWMRALPVDSHHYRVAQRLGLIAPNVAVGASHAILEGQLPASWTTQQIFDNHQALMRHGQQCCYHVEPACTRCPVLDLCPTGQARLLPTRAATSEAVLGPLFDAIDARDDG